MLPLKRCLFLVLVLLFSSQNCVAGLYLQENLRCNLRYNTGPGFGYQEAYSTVNLFLMPDIYTCAFPYLDLSWHRGNDSKTAANLGIGARYAIHETLLGWNVFYDYRQSPHNFKFNQLGVGCEALISEWDIRVNTYFPIGDHRSKAYDKKFHIAHHKKFYTANFDFP